MVDLSSEEIIALADVPAVLPKRRGGKAVHVSCIYRWAQRGYRGIRLETIQVGGTKCTSIEALQRFCDRLTDPQKPVPAESPSARERRREREQQQADEVCRADDL